MFGLVLGVANRGASVAVMALVAVAGLASLATAAPGFDGGRERAQLRGSGSFNSPAREVSFRGDSGRGGGGDRGGGGRDFGRDFGRGGGGGSHGGGGGGHDSSRTNVSIGINVGGGYSSGHYSRSSWGSDWNRHRAPYCDSGFSLRIGCAPVYCPPPRVICPPPVYVRRCEPVVIVRPYPTYVVSEPVVITQAPQPVYVTQAPPQVIIRQDPTPVIVTSAPAVQTRLDEVQTTSMTSVGQGAVITTASSNPSPINSSPVMASSTLPAGSNATVGQSGTFGGVAGNPVNDVVPSDLAISALRSGADTVVISITGSNVAANYQTRLAIEEYQGSTPVLRLRNAPPVVTTGGTIGGAPAATSQTAFSLNASVKAPATASTLNIRVGVQEYQVQVIDAPRIGG